MDSKKSSSQSLASYPGSFLERGNEPGGEASQSQGINHRESNPGLLV